MVVLFPTPQPPYLSQKPDVKILAVWSLLTVSLNIARVESEPDKIHYNKQKFLISKNK